MLTVIMSAERRISRITLTPPDLLDVTRSARRTMNGIMGGQLYESKPILPQIVAIINAEAQWSFGNAVKPVGNGGFVYRTGSGRIVRLNGDRSSLTLRFGDKGSYDFARQTLRYIVGCPLAEMLEDKLQPGRNKIQLIESSPGEIGALDIQHNVATYERLELTPGYAFPR